jgi:hypothetical protein
VQEGELSGGSRLFLIILTLLMMKCHDQNEAFRNYQKFKIIFEYTAPNGAFKIIDYSRLFLLITSVLVSGSVQDTN